MGIHPTAIIYDGAKVASDAEIGPYCIIGPNVEIANKVKLISHVCIDGYTKIDEGTTVYPFASLGFKPQDLKFAGEKSTVYIGKNNVIREYVTIHPGTTAGGLKTEVGNNCLFMIGVHIAHDCIVGDNVILANNVALGGHVVVGNFAIVGGLCGVHQYVRIGAHAIIGAGTTVVEDVIPYGSVIGERGTLEGLNIIGMKRRNVDRESINAIRDAFKILFINEETVLEIRIEEVTKKHGNNNRVMEIIEFLKADTSRSICMPKGKVTLDG